MRAQQAPLRRLAEAGSADAAFRLGFVFLRSGGAAAQIEALTLLRRAAGADHPAGLLMLGEQLLYGTPAAPPLARDRAEGLAALRRGAAAAISSPSSMGSQKGRARLTGSSWA